MNAARALLPYEIIAICKDALSQNRGRLLRQPLVDDLMKIDSTEATSEAIDELDSVRDFLDTIENFIQQKAQRIAAARKRLGLPEGLRKNDKGTLRGAKGNDRLVWFIKILANRSSSQSSKRYS